MCMWSTQIRHQASNNNRRVNETRKEGSMGSWREVVEDVFYQNIYVYRIFGE